MRKSRHPQPQPPQVEFMPIGIVDEPEPPLDWKVFTYHLTPLASVDDEINRDGVICGMLDNGWRIEEVIICAPSVQLILSKEKESENDYSTKQ